MKKIVVGILAHVDAGKTTLSEGLLYAGGTIRKAGRVDHKDTYLDTGLLERQRGITIFDKQAKIHWKDTELTLIDTPGHVDFSAEMERSLSMIDYGILVISAAEGITGHTKTVWKLLDHYHVPVFLFVNKMDLRPDSRQEMMEKIHRELSIDCVDFSDQETSQDIWMESAAVCDERIMEHYLATGEVSVRLINEAIEMRKIFPCFFGSALKMEGVENLLNGLDRYTRMPEYTSAFGAVVYKISRDSKGNRLTHMKITGGSLKTKDVISEYDEKVNQIRIYSGEKFETVNEALPGEVCEVLGLDSSHAGDVLGDHSFVPAAILEPVMTYQVILDESVNRLNAYRDLQKLEEELPEISVHRDENTGNLHVRVMGQVQMEILKHLVKERFDYEIEFGSGNIVYKETIAESACGVGHFEPLRHYAEAHLLLEPAERGSGIQIETGCSEDMLAKNWQRLIMTHLAEKTHKGVMIGAELTDVKITIIGGRAHTKHTEGGDFRQAVYRALRQGLMQTESLLLEPYYNFVLTVPGESVGRALSDLDQISANFELTDREGDMAVITGFAPVSQLQEYGLTVASYTRGQGNFMCTFRGYEICHNTEEILMSHPYDAREDLENTPDSVFCSHGAGMIVPWDEVYEYMHVDPARTLESLDREYRKTLLDKENIRNYLGKQISEDLMPDRNMAGSAYGEKEDGNRNTGKSGYQNDKELEEIFLRTYGNRKPTSVKEEGRLFEEGKKTGKADKPYVYRPVRKKEQYLLVDGYNIIFAWKELKELAALNLDAARDRLLDLMSNYQGYRQIRLMVVFDAYKVKGFGGEKQKYHNIWVVFTKEAQTADGYIEKFAHDHGSRYDITVATSDGLEQIIILGQGCHLISAREFEREVESINHQMRETYLEKTVKMGEAIRIPEQEQT